MADPVPAPLPELSLAARNYTASHWLPHDRDSLDLDAPYQRGSVWDVERRRNLIRSLLMGLPIGAVVVAQLPYTRDRNVRVVDGKQRIEALRAFFAGDVTVPGWWFDPADLADGEAARGRDVTAADLSDRGRRVLENKSFPSLEFDSATEYTRRPDGSWDRRTRTEEEMVAAEAAVYLLVNFGGVAQTDRDRARAETIADRP